MSPDLIPSLRNEPANKFAGVLRQHSPAFMLQPSVCFVRHESAEDKSVADNPPRPLGWLALISILLGWRTMLASMFRLGLVCSGAAGLCNRIGVDLITILRIDSPRIG